MVGQGRSYREIMNILGIPERSFYRYLSQAFEHDRQLMQEEDKNNLALELRVFHDRLTNAYRRLVLITSNGKEDIYQLRIELTQKQRRHAKWWHWQLRN
jgi:hypothetical protein